MPHSDRQNQPFVTHEIENQPPELGDLALYETDFPLVEGLNREGAAWSESAVSQYGRMMGSSEVVELGRLANEFPPQLKTHDPFGRRIDEVDYHPAWHDVMRINMAHSVHNWPWRESRPGVYVARTAKHYMLSQIEAGSACPVTMTFASLPALRHEPDVAAEWEPRIVGTEYQPAMVPAEDKQAVVIGMAMTEKQGGSDVRTNSTRAHPLDADGKEYELVGHKWFCSAPMSDAFLTLAQTDRGLTCFLVPRWAPNRTRNAFHIQRLKDKLGNRSNASSEIEYRGTWARRVGEEGRGISTIIEMVHHTRLDCVSGSAGLMRRALVRAAHHTRHRNAFGRVLNDQPLMRNVIADLALESEAATALMLRLAAAYDRAEADENERAFARIATAVAKYWVCKRAPYMIYEAMECLGGNGYAEESGLPRLYREAPVNAIWEGSGNVICLDVLRAAAREPASLPALLAEIRKAAGAAPSLDAWTVDLEAELAETDDIETRARGLVERLALALQASLLVRNAPAAVADAFCASRLASPLGGAFGTLPGGVDFETISARVLPSRG
jgi:putative acyl-CoA dehydrogenase